MLDRRSTLALALGTWVLLLAPTPANAYTLKHTDSGAVVRWYAPRLDVRLHASADARFAPREARRALAMATDAWRGVGGPELVIDPAVDSRPYVAGRPGLDVVVAEPWPFEPGPLAVTVTTFREDDGAILDADIMIDPSQPLALLEERDSDPEHFDLASVLAHELGHALGLDESESDPDGTMWPRMRRGTTHARTLAQDDEDGIAALYPEGPSVATYGCGGGAAVAGRARTSWALAPWMAIALFALKRRSRARRSTLVAGLVLAVLVAPMSTAPSGFASEAHGRVIDVRRGVDGIVRTRVERDGRMLTRVGGCIDGICQRVRAIDPRDGAS